ncbi:MAG: zinc ribbon domain-containing protein [Oscillospiraceae bacterium]|nr:zinc ribbon domain-containing protein [Oscillospiraceae bacterium]
MNKKPDPINDAIAILASFLPVVFMVFWTAMTVQFGAPLLFPVIGTGFLLLTLLSRIQNIRKIRERRQNEDYYGSSAYPGGYDSATDTRENEYYQDFATPSFSGELGDISMYTDTNGTIYCPYCGVKIAHDFEYCPHCGKKLPF